MNETQPVLSAEPWYTSQVQVAAVIAAASQLASILFRWFGLPITDEQVDVYSADALQFVTVAAGLWAIFKRSRSNIAPLTFSEGGAALRNVQNPPLLKTDPTKGVQK